MLLLFRASNAQSRICRRDYRAVFHSALHKTEVEWQPVCNRSVTGGIITVGDYRFDVTADNYANEYHKDFLRHASMDIIELGVNSEIVTYYDKDVARVFPCCKYKILPSTPVNTLDAAIIHFSMVGLHLAVLLIVDFAPIQLTSMVFGIISLACGISGISEESFKRVDQKIIEDYNKNNQT